MTHRQTITAFRHYFRKNEPALQGPKFKALRHELFSDPMRMIMYIYSNICQDSASTPTQIESQQWIADDCPNINALDRLLFHANHALPAPESRMPMLRGYLQRLLELDAESEPYAVAGYDFLNGARLLQPVAAIREEFKAHLPQAFRILQGHSDVVHWLACQLLERYDPALLRTDLDALQYGGQEFALAQADIHLLMDADLYSPSLGRREIRDTATALRDAVSNHGMPSQEILLSQMHAALLHARAKGDTGLRLPFTADSYIAALQILHNLQVDRENARYDTLRTALAYLQTPPPMRRTIAEDLLRELGVDPFLEGRPKERIDSCVGQTKSLLDFYMDDCTDSALDVFPSHLKLDTLPDLNQAYDAAFNEWHEEYKKTLGVVLYYGVEELAPDDYHFFHNNDVELLQPTVTASKRLPYVIPTFWSDPSVYKDVKLSGEQTLLFAADNGSERRYFQISLGERDAPIVARIDCEDIDDYIDAHRSTFFDDGKLASTIEDALETRTGVDVLDTYAGGSDAPRFARTGAVLASFARKKIHEFGYERTGHRQSVDEIQAFLLGFVPGYECITEALGKNPEKAAVPCTVDGYSIALPLLGRIAHTAHKLARLPLKLLTPLAKRQLGEAFTRHGTMNVLGAIAQHLQAPLTRIGKDFAYGMGKDLLRIGDPGFEMSYQVLGEIRKLYSLARHLRNAPHTMKHLIRQLRRNPHTQHTARRLMHHRHSEPRQDLRQQAQAQLQLPARLSQAPASQVLQARYEGLMANDATGIFLQFNLPPHTEVRPMPLLEYVAPFNELEDSVVLYKIGERTYGWDTRHPSTLVDAQTLLSRQPLCRVPREGNAACILVKDIAQDSDSARPGYQVTFGRRQVNICQLSPGTQVRTIAAPTVEIYPEAIKIAGEQKSIVPLLDQAYEVTATAGGKPKLEAIGDNWSDFPLEAGDTVLPATGKLVSYSNVAGVNLYAVELELKNGLVKCEARAHYGSYLAADGTNAQIYRGMIRLNGNYVRIDFPDPAARTGAVRLTQATPDEIAVYNQFQAEALAKYKRSTSNTFSLTLPADSAASVLRLYRNYNLKPYRDMLDEMARLPGLDAARAAKALDLYIADPENAARLAGFDRIKSLADDVLGRPHRSYSSTIAFTRHLADAIRHKNARLDIHALDPESPRAEQTLANLATIFPAIGPIRDQYHARLATVSRTASASARASHVKSIERDAIRQIRRALRGRNPAYAEVWLPVDGRLVLQETYFSVSGKQQGSPKGYQRVETITPDEYYKDANKAVTASGGPGTGPAHHHPDFDENGNQKLREYDAENVLLTAIRRAYAVSQAGRVNNIACEIKIVTLVKPCVMCMLEMALFSDAYPNANLDVVFVTSRDGAGFGGASDAAEPRGPHAQDAQHAPRAPHTRHRPHGAARQPGGRRQRSIHPTADAGHFLQMLAEAVESPELPEFPSDEMEAR